MGRTFSLPQPDNQTLVHKDEIEKLLFTLSLGTGDHYKLERLGSLLFTEGYKKEAISVFERCGVQHISTFSSLYFLGSAYLEENQHSKAEIALLKAFSLNPDHLECLLKLLLVYLKKKNFLETLRIGLIGIRERPLEYQLQYFVSLALFNMQKFKKAEEHARTCLQLKPEHERAWNLLGNLCREKGDLIEAVSCYSLSLEHCSQRETSFESVIRFNLACAYLELRDFANAKIHSEKVAILESVTMRPLLVKLGLHRLIKNEWISKALSLFPSEDKGNVRDCLNASKRESAEDPCLLENYLLMILEERAEMQSSAEAANRKELETALKLSKIGKRDKLTEILIELGDSVLFRE